MVGIAVLFAIVLMMAFATPKANAYVSRDFMGPSVKKVGFFE